MGDWPSRVLHSDACRGQAGKAKNETSEGKKAWAVVLQCQAASTMQGPGISVARLKRRQKSTVMHILSQALAKDQRKHRLSQILHMDSQPRTSGPPTLLSPTSYDSVPLLEPWFSTASVSPEPIRNAHPPHPRPIRLEIGGGGGPAVCVLTSPLRFSLPFFFFVVVRLFVFLAMYMACRSSCARD